MKLSRGEAEVLRYADEITRRLEGGEKYAVIHRDLVERGGVSLGVSAFRELSKRLPRLDNLSVSRLFGEAPCSHPIRVIPITGKVAA